MSGLGSYLGQLTSALVGILVGGLITFFVTRWQLTRTITADAVLAADQRLEDAREASHEREVGAARLLLEWLADLYAYLPSLPDVGLDSPALSREARQRCESAMQSLRRGMHTELLMIEDKEVRRRFRELVGLVYDVGWRGVGRPRRKRQIRDVRAYLRYVQATLSAVIEASPLPVTVGAPVLDRSERGAWVLPELGAEWADPADRS